MIRLWILNLLKKVGKYQVKQKGALNHNYNLLTGKQKEMIKTSMIKYHNKLSIAIQQAYFFNKIAEWKVKTMKEKNQLFYYDLFNTNNVQIFYKYYGSTRDELIISQLKAGRTQSQIAKELEISQ